MSDAKVRILEVASKEFMNRGYEAVTMKNLAEILEIKPPSLYYHFPGGKESIYVAVVEHTLEELNYDLMRIIKRYSDDLRLTMIEIGRWAKDNMIMSPVVMTKIDVPILSKSNQRDLGISTSVKLFSPIREMFSSAIKHGMIRQVDPNVISGMFLSMLEGLDERINSNLDKMEIWTKSIDILLEGITIRDQEE